MHSTLCIQHFASPALHHTLFIAHFALHTLHHILCIAHFAWHNLHYTLCISIAHSAWYDKLTKQIQPNRSFLGPPEFPPKFSSDPFKGENKIVPIMGFMVFKSTGLDSRFQRKNLVSKLCTESRDIGQNVSNFAGLVWKANFGHFFGNILGLSAHFSKSIFALKLWVQAGQFEYHEPHNRTTFFSPLKGSELNFRGNWGGFRKLRFD